LVSWMAFWFHLGGSQASGAVRSGVLLLAAMLYICRPKTLVPDCRGTACRTPLVLPPDCRGR
jgi:hypothetical protein